MTNRGKTAEKKLKTSLFSLFITFLKIGFLTIGGGLAMMGVMHHEIVTRRRWLREKDFVHIISLATAIPGAIAVNMAFQIGKEYKGIPGIIVSLLGIILPSFTIILLIAAFLTSYFSCPIVQHFFAGASAAVTALIAYSLYFYSRNSGLDLYNIVIAVGCFLVLVFFNIHPLIIIFASTVVRYVLPHREEKVLK